MPSTSSIPNVYNHEAIDAYLLRMAKEDKQTAHLLSIAIRKAIFKEQTCFEDVTTLPKDAPDWMIAKWSNPDIKFIAFKNPPPQLHDKISHIADWIKAAQFQFKTNPENPMVQWLNADHCDEKGRPKKLLKLGTIQRAYEEADAAMKKNNVRNRQKMGAIPAAVKDDKTVKVVKRFKDGYCMVRIHNTDGAEIEGNLMGHCVGEGAYHNGITDGTTEIYSLRDANNKPHATLEVDTNTHTLEQCKGKENQPPGEKYFPYIKEFLKAKKYKLSEDPCYTGTLLHNGRYHSLYQIPRNYVFKDDLDLMKLKKRVSFGKGCVIKGNLLLPTALYHDAVPAVMATSTMLSHHDENDELHNLTLADGRPLPALQVFDQNSTLIMQEYYNHSNVENFALPDGTVLPASQKFYEDGKVKYRAYISYQQGSSNLVLADGSIIPAVQRFHDNGILESQYYFTYGKNVNQVLADGSIAPAAQFFYDTGETLSKTYMDFGVSDNIILKDGTVIPSQQTFSRDQKVIEIEYYTNGKRDDIVFENGIIIPAVQTFHSNGTKSTLSYYTEGSVNNIPLTENILLPATLGFYQNGFLSSLGYRNRNTPCNIELPGQKPIPAHIEFNENEEVITANWANGKELNRKSIAILNAVIKEITDTIRTKFTDFTDYQCDLDKLYEPLKDTTTFKEQEIAFA